MKHFAKSIVKSPATFIIVVLLLLLTMLVGVRAVAQSSDPISVNTNDDIEVVDQTRLDKSSHYL
jgi:hypothetical protein